MKRAAIYCRVSTMEQAQKGYSLQYQSEFLPQLARGQGFIVETEDIFSEVLSGATDSRPEYNRLLSLVVEGVYQAVFVTEKSRLSRTEDRREEERVIKILQNCGCLVITPGMIYDPSTLDGELVWDILSAIDRNERKRIKKRNANSCYIKASKGDFLGGLPPTGYTEKQYDIHGNVHFKIDEDIMRPVRFAFKWALQGILVFQISKRLNKMGFKTINNKKFGYKAILYWLRNSHYAGYTHIRGSLDCKAPNPLRFEVNNFLEPIISKEDFAKVQQILDNRAAYLKSISQPSKRHPLAGIIICSNCKKKMVIDVKHKGPTQKDYRWTYRCNSKYQDRYCTGTLPKAIPYNVIHLLVLKMLPQLKSYGYDINQQELDEFCHHIENTVPKTQLSEVWVMQLKELFNRYLVKLEFYRTGSCSKNYKYTITRFNTKRGEYFIMDQSNEIQLLVST